MAKTLDDLTPEQREACVGMWCNILSDEPDWRTVANHIIRYVNTSYRRKPGFARLIAISPARDVFPLSLIHI